MAKREDAKIGKWTVEGEGEREGGCRTRDTTREPRLQTSIWTLEVVVVCGNDQQSDDAIP